MATLTMARRTGEHILSEANGTRSREQIVIAAGAGVLEAGTVLGKVTSSQKHVPYDPAATNGAETAAGILYAGVDATSADVAAVAHVRDCEVAESLLTGIDAAGITELASAGVIVR